ncbi:oligosaccharyl transferase delta subunit [Obba rivulosa]|uniref:Ribophorin II n=1 Tax=Obba rivulosa TaxID=1052685 RepID=A0A8E2AMG5_9APHY|nr:oligosaccharyl transferase delta subunit [Obba rivulosa]
MGVLRCCLLALLAVHAAALTLQSPRVTVTGPDAAQLFSDSLSVDGPPPTLTLGPDDALKLTFQVVESEGGKGVQPHQAFLRFYDETTGEEGIQPVRVTPGGKAKFELNMSKPPASLPPSSTAPLKVSLLLGSFTHAPAKYTLFDLHVPPSQPAPAHPDEPSFHALPEIQHTFRPEPVLPPRPVSATFAGLVLAPWALLLGLWSQIGPRVPRLFSPHILPFVASLAAFEGLLFWYWVDLRLGEVLLYGGVLSLVTALTGKQALSTIGEWRTGKK